MAFPLTSIGSFPCSVNEPIYESCCLNTGGHPDLLLGFKSGLTISDHASIGRGNPLLSSTSIRQFIREQAISVLFSPSGLLSILHRSVHFRSSLIEPSCNDHSHVALFQFAQYHSLKEQHQLVVSKVVANLRVVHSYFRDPPSHLQLCYSIIQRTYS